jgi:outer membrane protein TolC
MNYALPDLRPMAPLGMLQLQVMQMVPLPGKLSAAGGAARARSDAGHARVDQALWTARAEVADAFYDLYQWNARLDVARGTLALLGDIQQTAQAMYRVGSASQADVLKAQVAVATLAEDTVRMVAERSAAAARLEAPLDTSLAEPQGPVALPSFPAAVPTSDSLLALALRAGPDVRATRDELSAAEHERDLAARNVWPDLEVGVQLGRRPGTVGNLMGSVMVGASIPVFAGSRQRQATRAADAMATMRRADVRTAEADTRAAVLTAYADLQRARALSALYRTTILPQTEAAAASALASYRVGRVDFTTVLDNRLAVDRYEQAIHELEAAEGKAWAALEALTARELIDANSTTGAAPGGDR